MKMPAIGLLLAATFLTFWGAASRADSRLYRGAVHLEARSASLIAIHEHDWSKVVAQDPLVLRFSTERPFGTPADVAWLELRGADGHVIARTSTPPLTRLTISADGRYVIGLSNIKLLNLTQLVVIDSNGVIRLRRRIVPEAACLSVAEYGTLLARFPTEWAQAERMLASVAQAPAAWKLGSTIYVDVELFPTSWLRDALLQNMCPLPWSRNFRQSVTNVVEWYDEDDPAPVVEEKDGKPESISIRDRRGVRISIPWELPPADAEQSGVAP